jgi:hypothetical protein
MRNTYKVISWSKQLGQGLVTDGSIWDGKQETITVFSSDFADDAYLQGFLIPGEIISADEDMNRCANRKLENILVENGSRSIPARTVDTRKEAPREPFNPDPEPCPIMKFYPTYEEFRDLERRVTKLERGE